MEPSRRAMTVLADYIREDTVGGTDGQAPLVRQALRLLTQLRQISSRTSEAVKLHYFSSHTGDVRYVRLFAKP